MSIAEYNAAVQLVALFARAWIEIADGLAVRVVYGVALFARAWIEISGENEVVFDGFSRPLCEGVD